MEDGAKLLEGEDFPESASGGEIGQVTCTQFCQEIKCCLDFLTLSIVKLRYHLSNMPLVDAERYDSVDGDQVPFAKMEVDGEDGLVTRWSKMMDEVL